MSKKSKVDDFLTGIGHIEKDLAECCEEQKDIFRDINRKLDDLETVEECMIHKLDDLHGLIRSYVE